MRPDDVCPRPSDPPPTPTRPHAPAIYPTSVWACSDPAQAGAIGEPLDNGRGVEVATLEGCAMGTSAPRAQATARATSINATDIPTPTNWSRSVANCIEPNMRS